jgi:hypothetical protein
MSAIADNGDPDGAVQGPALAPDAASCLVSVSLQSYRLPETLKPRAQSSP